VEEETETCVLEQQQQPGETEGGYLIALINVFIYNSNRVFGHHSSDVVLRWNPLCTGKILIKTVNR
jgi:hypothetical protein